MMMTLEAWMGYKLSLDLFKDKSNTNHFMTFNFDEDYEEEEGDDRVCTRKCG